jgi:hypothetical protein
MLPERLAHDVENARERRIAEAAVSKAPASSSSMKTAEAPECAYGSAGDTDRFKKESGKDRGWLQIGISLITCGHPRP